MPDNNSSDPSFIDPQTLTRFASNIDSIDYTVIVSDEGFPLEFAGIDKQKAEAAAALAVDLLLTASSDAIRDLAGITGNEVIVAAKEDKVIDVSKARSLITVVMGKRSVVEATTRSIRNYIEGNRTKCPHCGADLTLQAYKCSKCGKTYPFTSPICPHCGAVEKIKLCPSCGKPISWDGRPVKATKDPFLTKISIFEGILGGVLAAIGTLSLSGNPVISAGVGAGGAAVIGLALYKLLPEKYIIENGRD